MTSKKPPMGNDRFTDALADSIVLLASEGKTNKQIAKILNIGERSIYYNQKRHPEFGKRMAEAKSGPDDEVEYSLFKRAIGYSHKSEKIFYDKDTGQIVRAPTVEHYPPDTKAAEFWLKNRRPEQWRDKSVVEHEGLDKMSDSELRAEVVRLTNLLLEKDE